MSVAVLRFSNPLCNCGLKFLFRHQWNQFSHMRHAYLFKQCCFVFLVCFDGKFDTICLFGWLRRDSLTWSTPFRIFYTKSTRYPEIKWLEFVVFVRLNDSISIDAEWFGSQNYVWQQSRKCCSQKLAKYKVMIMVWQTM